MGHCPLTGQLSGRRPDELTSKPEQNPIRPTEHRLWAWNSVSSRANVQVMQGPVVKK
jgi:hypothetical protein